MTTIQKNQAHPLWSAPECIRFPCHVSPELLVTSAVKSPLVRRKVRPWAMAASNWGSWARVANAKRSPTAERTLLSMIPNGGLRNPPTRRRMERISETQNVFINISIYQSFVKKILFLFYQEFEKQRSASEGEANLRIFLQMPCFSVGIFYFATRDKRCFYVSLIGFPFGRRTLFL